MPVRKRTTTKAEGTPVSDGYAAYMAASKGRMPHAVRTMSSAKQAARLTPVTSK